MILGSGGVPGPVPGGVLETPGRGLETPPRGPGTPGRGPGRGPGTPLGTPFGTWVFEGPEQVWGKSFKTPFQPHLKMTVLPKPVKRCPKMVKK